MRSRATVRIESMKSYVSNQSNDRFTVYDTFLLLVLDPNPNPDYQLKVIRYSDFHPFSVTGSVSFVGLLH